MLITSCGLQRLTVQTTVRSTPASPVHPTGVSNKGMLLPLPDIAGNFRNRVRRPETSNEGQLLNAFGLPVFPEPLLFP